MIFLFALIASFRIPESDLEYYLSNFQLAKTVSFFEYILVGARDPLFNLFTFLLANFGFAESHYVFFISFLFYFLISLSINHIKVSKKIKTYLFISILLNPLIFSLHIHLIRQFLALSIFLYIIFKRKKDYFFIVPALTHFSFVIIYGLSKLFVNIKSMLIILIFVLIIFVNRSFLTDLPFVGYLIRRSTGEFLDFDTPSIGTLIVGTFSLAIYVLSKKLDNNPFPVFLDKVYSSILLIFFSSFFFSTELFYRVFPLIVFFLHFFVFRVTLHMLNKKSFHFFWGILSLFLAIIFVVSIQYGRWEYNFI